MPQEFKKDQEQARSDAAAAMIARDSQADADLMAAAKSISEATIASPMKQASANVATPGTAQRQRTQRRSQCRPPRNRR